MAVAAMVVGPPAGAPRRCSKIVHFVDTKLLPKSFEIFLVNGNVIHFRHRISHVSGRKYFLLAWNY